MLNLNVTPELLRRVREVRTLVGSAIRRGARGAVREVANARDRRALAEDGGVAASATATAATAMAAVVAPSEEETLVLVANDSEFELRVLPTAAAAVVVSSSPEACDDSAECAAAAAAASAAAAARARARARADASSVAATPVAPFARAPLVPAPEFRPDGDGNGEDARRGCGNGRLRQLVHVPERVSICVANVVRQRPSRRAEPADEAEQKSPMAKARAADASAEAVQQPPEEDDQEEEKEETEEECFEDLEDLPANHPVRVRAHQRSNGRSSYKSGGWLH